jgi:hypothetical protein
MSLTSSIHMVAVCRKIDEIDQDEAESLYKTVTGMKLQCEALQKELERKVPGFGLKE